MALKPVVWSPAWMVELETETETQIEAAAAIGYSREPLTYFKEWTNQTPIYITAARHPVYNTNRVKANVQAAVDLFGLNVSVPPQFTPAPGVPGDPVTDTKMEQLVDALTAVGDRITAIVAYLEEFGPRAGVTYAGGGLML